MHVDTQKLHTTSQTGFHFSLFIFTPLHIDNKMRHWNRVDNHVLCIEDEMIDAVSGFFLRCAQMELCELDRCYHFDVPRGFNCAMSKEQAWNSWFERGQVRQKYPTLAERWVNFKKFNRWFWRNSWNFQQLVQTESATATTATTWIPLVHNDSDRWQYLLSRFCSLFLHFNLLYYFSSLLLIIWHFFKLFFSPSCALLLHQIHIWSTRFHGLFLSLKINDIKGFRFASSDLRRPQWIRSFYVYFNSTIERFRFIHITHRCTSIHDYESNGVGVCVDFDLICSFLLSLIQHQQKKTKNTDNSAQWTMC